MLARLCKLLGLCHGKFWVNIFQKSGFATRKYANSNAEVKRFLIYWNSQITKYGRDGNVEEAESIFLSVPTKNIVTHTAMLTAYAHNGQLEKARQVFDVMPERNVASWNAMITAYVRSRSGIDEGYRLFLQMPERNLVSYAAMIMGFVNSGRFHEAERLYSNISVNIRDPACSNVLLSGYLKGGELEKATQIFHRMDKKDVVSWSSMINGYCKYGGVNEAREIFDLMPERNEVTWSVMLNGYMKMDKFEDGFDMFLRMRRESVVKLEPTILTIILEACGRFSRYGEGCQVHGLVLHLGFDFDTFLGNSVITMYCRFGFIDIARVMFDTMLWKDLVTWNSLIAGYVQAGNVEEAYELFERAPEKDAVSWTTMITGYCDRGLTEKCIELFKMMPEKDDVSWTALISAFIKNEEYEKAISWFFMMLRNGTRPNVVTFSSVLSASAALALLNQGVQLHAHVIKRDMETDLSIQNSLVSMYSKCGSLDSSCRIFKSIIVPNIVSFNSMITGLAQNGLGKEAIKLFEQILDKGLKPTEITFLGVLSACTHIGLVEEGWNFFSSMKSLYGIDPGPDHYACMVDLLGRAGFLDRAMNLINSMPFEPHSGVWGALLSASRTHRRLDLAKLAAEKVCELEPENAAPYVVLSDMYSLVGQKSDEENIRMAKKLKRIKKSPGCSWIIVKNDLTVFLSGERSHGSFEEMKNILQSILKEMKELYLMSDYKIPP